MNKFNIILKIILILIFIYFLNKYDIVSILKDPHNFFKEEFTNLGNKNTENSNNNPSKLEKFLNIEKLETPDKSPYKLLIPDQFKIYNLGLGHEGSFLDKVSKIMKKSIYPCNSKYTEGSLDNLEKINKGELDIAFVDENLALEYQAHYPINFSTICVCFHQSFIFITPADSEIRDFDDIVFERITQKDGKKRKIKIGVLEYGSADYYQLSKIFRASNINMTKDVDIETYTNYNSLGTALYEKKVDIIYILTMQKNPVINQLVKFIKCRFISPKLDSRKINLMPIKENITKRLSFQPFIYLHNIVNRKENQNSVKHIFDLNNTILYLKEEEIFLIDFIKIIESLFDISIEKFIESHTRSFNKLDNMYKYFYKKSNRNKLNFVFIPNILTNRENHQKILEPYLAKETPKKVFLYNDPIFNNLIESEYLKTKNKIQKRNLALKNEFRNIFNSVIELNSYPNNINTNNFIETYSSRILLICRNNLQDKNIQSLLRNLIIERDDIISAYQYYLTDINDYEKMSTQELQKQKINLSLKTDTTIFKINELLTVKDLPIHNGALEIYRQLGYIKEYQIEKDNI